MKLEYTRAAGQDLEDIWAYSFKTWGRYKAADYLDQLADCAEALARAEISGTAEDRIAPGLRRQLVASHVIWFRIGDAVLTVIRVLHQRMDAADRLEGA